MVEKKHRLKEAKWGGYDKPRAKALSVSLKEIKARVAVADKAKAKARAADARTMITDPSGMDAFGREFWEMHKMEIMQKTTISCHYSRWFR
jgi:hypothetical protein